MDLEPLDQQRLWTALMSMAIQHAADENQVSRRLCFAMTECSTRDYCATSVSSARARHSRSILTRVFLLCGRVVLWWVSSLHAVVRANNSAVALVDDIFSLREQHRCATRCVVCALVHRKHGLVEQKTRDIGLSSLLHFNRYQRRLRAQLSHSRSVQR
jgi:hypothetical protein